MATSPQPPHPFPHPLPALNMSGDTDDDGDSFFVHRNTYDLNSKIMLTAIISLSIVVLLVIVLHIYARYVLRRQARDMAIIRRLGLTATTRSVEPPSTGLDPAVIASLPIFVYKKTPAHGGDDQEIECSVCLSRLEDQEMARILPNCKHTFHAECVDRWLSRHATCPICRTQAEPRVQPVPREGPVGGIPTAPPLEGHSDGGNQTSSHKASGSISRLSSFRRILSRERSSRRIQAEVQEEVFEDLERQ